MWVQRGADGELLRKSERRADLEETLENEALLAGGAWLGQLVGGMWEIRSKAVPAALAHVLQGLVATGAVCALPPQHSGKSHMLYIVANQYCAGEAYPRSKRAREVEADEAEAEAEPEEMADIEIERARNIARNNEILRQLGLA